MDVLYVVGNKSEWGFHEELRYSIRAFKEHYKNLGAIYVVGNLPEWCEGVVHIPMGDIYGKCKPANIVAKVMRGCCTNISEDFIYCADDYFLTRDVSDEDLLKIPNQGSLKNFDYSGDRYFLKVLGNTVDYLKSRAYGSYINCENHFPRVINKHRYLKIMSEVPFAKGLGITPFIPYFNSFDHKRFSLGMSGAGMVNKYMDAEKVRDVARKNICISISNGETSEAIKGFVRSSYPGPTEYERPFGMVECPDSLEFPETLDGCGVMMIAFGHSYESISPKLAKSIRKYSSIPIEVHTNITSTVLSKEWDGIQNLSFVFHDMQDWENRIVKTQLGKYSGFDKTLYIDVDSIVLSKDFLKLFALLDSVDVIFPEWKHYSLEHLDKLGESSYNFRQFAKIYRRFSINRELLVSGGICCFRKNKAMESFWGTFRELWEYTGSKQDMPGLNGAIFHHRRNIRYILTSRAEFNNTDSRVIKSCHSVSDKDLTSFTRTRINDITGEMEYIDQGNLKFYTKPKVAILYDVFGWAFHDIAVNLKKHLSKHFSVDVVNFRKFDESRYDCIISFTPRMTPKGANLGKYIIGISSNHSRDIHTLRSLRIGFANDKEVLKKISGGQKYYCPNGVNTGFFSDVPRKNIVSSIATIGSHHRAEHKGRGRILSLSKSLQVPNLSRFVSPGKNALSKEHLRNLYKNIGVYVVSSESETGPQPMLEALSMGVPIVANRTGLAVDVIKDNVNGFLIDDFRDLNVYRQRLRYILSNKSVYLRMSMAASETAKSLDWSVRYANFLKMINDFLY